MMLIDLQNKKRALNVTFLETDVLVNAFSDDLCDDERYPLRDVETVPAAYRTIVQVLYCGADGKLLKEAFLSNTDVRESPARSTDSI